MIRPRIYQQTAARRQLLGTEHTMNPTPAAAMLLGSGVRRGAFTRALSSLRKRRRSVHRGNPLPAAIGVLTGLGGLGRKFKGREARDAERFALVDSLAQRAAIGDAGALAQLQARASFAPRGFATNRAINYAAGELAKVQALLAEKALATRRETAAERKAAAAEEKAAREQREARFLKAGSDVASLLGTVALRGRGLRPRPRRRRRPRSREIY